MAVSRRAIALTVVAAVSVGIGTWATVTWLERRPAFPGPQAQAGGRRMTSDGQRITATLFYISADGTRLEPVQREVAFAEGTAEQAKRIVEALLGPPPGALASAMPTGATLRALYLADDGAAYVDFSPAVRSNHPGGSLNEIFTVYAIVSALTVNLPAVTSVQILIDGHEVDTLAGHVDLRRPLPNAPQWMEKGPS
jgi:spore germination protein GerM